VTNERIDETIDRVASELTAVPPDLSFSARLRERLPDPRRRTTPLLLASAIAALVIAIAMFARYAPSSPPQSPPARAGLAPARDETTIASGPVTSVPDPRADTSGDETVGKRGTLAIDLPGMTPAEVDSPVLAALVVDELNVDAVDVAPLDITTIEISDIDIGQEPKEPS
jgi:hypothetical protein